MTDRLERHLSEYWTGYDYLNAWRICLEDEVIRRPLLTQLLSHIPSSLGSVEFAVELAGEFFVVLFTHDFENVGGCINEAEVLLRLAETRLITLFGTEGAAGAFNFEPYRSFPDRSVSRRVSGNMLKDFKFAPIEYAAIVSTDPVLVWGIEDRELYLRAVDEYGRPASSEYWAMITRRAPVLFENLIAKMHDEGEKIAAICLTSHNFSVGSQWMRERGISHIGIRATNSGATRFGRVDSALRGEPYDEQEAAEWEFFSGWKRPRGARYRGSKVAPSAFRRRRRAIVITGEDYTMTLKRQSVLRSTASVLWKRGRERT